MAPGENEFDTPAIQLRHENRGIHRTTRTESNTYLPCCMRGVLYRPSNLGRVITHFPDEEMESQRGPTACKLQDMASVPGLPNPRLCVLPTIADCLTQN